MEKKIKLIVLKQRYFEIVRDSELLINHNSNERACLLIVKLKFKNENYDFAIPWRSNVPNNKKIKNLVFSLPNTSKTKPGYKACLDFRKMTPLPRRFKSNDLYKKYKLYISNDVKTACFIQHNFSKIVKQAQNVLDYREKGQLHASYLVDIDSAIKKLKDAGYY